jgi:hypothetical protein
MSIQLEGPASISGEMLALWEASMGTNSGMVVGSVLWLRRQFAVAAAFLYEEPINASL